MEAQNAVKNRNIQQLSDQNDGRKIQTRRQSRRIIVGGNYDKTIE